MIYSQYGCEVSITKANMETGDLTVRLDGGKERPYHISRLKADGGIQEVLTAMRKVATDNLGLDQGKQT